MSHGFSNSTIRHDEPLSLRVFFPSGPRTFELRDGLTIGSDAACDVFIDHIDVEPHHARVMKEAGRWMLEGVFSNQVYLLDGTSFRELGLLRGTTFRVGPTIIQCVESRDDEERDQIIPEASPAARTGSTSTDDFVAAASVGPVPTAQVAAGGLESLANIPLHCARCSTLIAHLPLDAKFCPRCGQTLPNRPAHVSGDLTGSSTATRHPLLNLLLPLLDATLPVTLLQRMNGLDPARPATLLAYLNTLVRLGIRYESGDGTSKNVGQALRYYTKAAKLGSHPAQLRLAAGGLTTPTPPAPEPTTASDV